MDRGHQQECCTGEHLSTRDVQLPALELVLAAEVLDDVGKQPVGKANSSIVQR
jgi:hypothetical protein